MSTEVIITVCEIVSCHHSIEWHLVAKRSLRARGVNTSQKTHMPRIGQGCSGAPRCCARTYRAIPSWPGPPAPGHEGTSDRVSRASTVGGWCGEREGHAPSYRSASSVAPQLAATEGDQDREVHGHQRYDDHAHETSGPSQQDRTRYPEPSGALPLSLHML
jgi:hypothetical protein